MSTIPTTAAGKTVVSSVAGTLGGPIVAWAAMQFASTHISPECAGQVSELILYGATAAGGVLAGVVSWILSRKPRHTDAPTGGQ